MISEKIGILGGGSWATALIKIISDSGSKLRVNWYIRNKENIDHILKHRHNKHYLSSVEIQTDMVNISSDIYKIIQDSDILLTAIPAAFIQDAMSLHKADLSGKYIISGVKGMIPEHKQILAEYFNTVYDVPLKNIGIITGPCHAEEIALERLSYLTVASENQSFAQKIGSYFKTHYTEINISDDIYGTEYAAVLKNIYAIAAGICHGLGYGDNFLAVLISNAIREMKTFVDKVHPVKRDIKSSAYLGDLLVTAYSKFSRNRIFGNMIGKGYPVRSALLEMNMIPEGYYALESIYQIITKHQIDLPIIESVHSIVYLNNSSSEEIKKLTKQLN
jgi:glycerol-3-phosphate dehydrogenase (NAD(P)+)